MGRAVTPPPPAPAAGEVLQAPVFWPSFSRVPRGIESQPEEDPRIPGRSLGEGDGSAARPGLHLSALTAHPSRREAGPQEPDCDPKPGEDVVSRAGKSSRPRGGRGLWASRRPGLG